MQRELLSSLAALVALMPAMMLSLKPDRVCGDRPDRWFWLTLVPAVFGPACWAAIQITQGWLPALATALWITIAATTLLFAVVSLVSRSGWRLLPLLMPYLGLVGALGTLALAAPRPLIPPALPEFWGDLHITVSVVTYALLTLAAVAAWAGFLQGRALKTKRPSPLTRALPPMAESESLQFRLLVWCQIVLGAGLVSGMAILYREHGVLFRLDHKTLLSFAAFFLIGALLLAQARTGVRGRAVARLVLIAYLLLTLAYPGVKFVRFVLISGFPS